MKFRNTVILLVVFGALLAYFLLLEKDQSPTSSTGTPTPTTAQVFTFASNDVVELSLTDGKNTTVLKRDNDAAPWKIVAPISADGDSVKINGVVQPMSALNSSRVFTDSESTGDLAAFGLANPKLTITAKLKDGQEFVLRVGDKTPDSTNAYVQKPDDKAIYLVSSTMTDSASDMVATPPVAPPTPTPTATETPTSTVGITTTEPLTSSAPVTGSTTIVTGTTTIIVASPEPATSPAGTMTATPEAPAETPPAPSAPTAQPTAEPTATATPLSATATAEVAATTAPPTPTSSPSAAATAVAATPTP